MVHAADDGGTRPATKHRCSWPTTVSHCFLDIRHPRL
jgi:hypothetical protein